MSATQREVILGIGGGIAAYKSADLLRRLQDCGYSVTVVPTPSSLHFVGSATWEALSGRAVTTSVWEKVDEVRHISLAKQADFIVIAPATADLIARIAMGRADDLLTNCVLASGAPKILVPAMHPSMWKNPATIANIATLRSRGFTVIDPEIGRLTGDDVGVGRFPSTQSILEVFNEVAEHRYDLVGKKIVVTAGGTREPIDPVRFIGNRSSGKQGIAIARAAAMRGASVTLIAANTEAISIAGVEVRNVETAEQMLRELDQSVQDCDFLFMAAAVADAKPVNTSIDKIKKAFFKSIELEQNPDLLLHLVSEKTGQIIVGFAAETSEHLESAKLKMQTKNLDMIYVNDVSDGAIFGKDETEGTILLANGQEMHCNQQSKDTLGNLLLDLALKQLG